MDSAKSRNTRTIKDTADLKEGIVYNGNRFRAT